MRINNRYRAIVKDTLEVITTENIDAITMDGCVNLKDGRFFLHSEISLLKSIGKDQNGEEIFEEDIIKSERFNGEAKIVWDEKEFAYFAQLLTDADKDVDESDMSVWNQKGLNVPLNDFAPFVLLTLRADVKTKSE